MGLGYQSISRLKQEPVFQHVSATTPVRLATPTHALRQTWSTNSKALGANLFSFSLNDSTSGGSELCWGCQNSMKYSGAFSWYPVSQQAFWQIGGASIYTNGQATAATDQQTIIDTGTTLIYAVRALLCRVCSRH